MIMVGETEFRPVGTAGWDARPGWPTWTPTGGRAGGLADPGLLRYDRPADQAVKVARIFNDLTLEMTAAGGDRLVPFCQVPLQDPDAACAELDRCLAAGHAGVEIGNHVGDRDLDDAGVVTFLQHCAEVGAPVFVHPWDMPGGPRLDRWMARWLTGMPAETHLSVLALILGGGVRPGAGRRCGSASPTAVAASRSGWAAPTTPGTAGATWSAARRAHPPSALRRPVLRRLGGVRAGGAAAAGRHDGARTGCCSAATTRTRWGSGRSARWSGTRPHRRGARCLLGGNATRFLGR